MRRYIPMLFCLYVIYKNGPPKPPKYKYSTI